MRRTRAMGDDDLLFCFVSNVLAGRLALNYSWALDDT
jgi:hypothetical protein